MYTKTSVLCTSLFICLFRIGKRRGEVQDNSAEGKNSEYGEKVSSEVLYVGSKKVGVSSNLVHGEVLSLNHHLRSLEGILGGASYCGQ